MGFRLAAAGPVPYTDAAWQASVKDDDLRKVIVKGGAAAGKSALMPPNPDLEAKPAASSPRGSRPLAQVVPDEYQAC